VNRELPLADANRVLATVLFTDIVDSTTQLARLGDRRRLEVLNDHDTAVRSSLAHFRGHEVKSTGDGFLATFDRPGQAIHAAVMIAQSLAALDISIRAGLHSGAIELMRHDIGGIAVHIAHRISSVAQPGAVVVSGTVKELCPMPVVAVVRTFHVGQRRGGLAMNSVCPMREGARCATLGPQDSRRGPG
jgi:class 3 adenylate cyclase